MPRGSSLNCLVIFFANVRYRTDTMLFTVYNHTFASRFPRGAVSKGSQDD